MRDWLIAHKPAARRPVHLLLAALLWTVIGALLVAFGVRWLMPNDANYLLPALGAALGVVKARFILDRAARRIVDRIHTRGDDRCLGGFLSVKSWVLVALMIAGGRLLRSSPLSRTIIGVLYTAIGSALIIAARHHWRAWRVERRELKTKVD